jgi:Fic family protein
VSLPLLEPLIPESQPLREQAAGLFSSASGLGRHLHPLTLRAVAELLRTVNCYYSNLIEGHNTHPVQIERAMRQEYAPDSYLRDLQLEAIAHIAVQRMAEGRLEDEPDLNVCGADFVRWLHREFYVRLPDRLRIVRDPEDGREIMVEPGMVRTYDVRVGDHIAPPSDDVPGLLERFAAVLDPANRSPVEALAVSGAVHHRLLWIHPFGDGNGRVVRLLSDAYLRRIGVAGAGLWTVARGLARRRDEYKRRLAAADAGRWDPYDGRGARSNRALVEFSEFFLAVCQDQLQYMGRLLEIDGLAERVRGYCKAREAGAITDPEGLAGREKFTPSMTRLLIALIYRGELPRAEVPEVAGTPERTARRFVQRLLDEGFVAAETHRAPIQLRIPSHAAPFVFPGLYAVA